MNMQTTPAETSASWRTRVGIAVFLAAVLGATNLLGSGTSDTSEPTIDQAPATTVLDDAGSDGVVFDTPASAGEADGAAAAAEQSGDGLQQGIGVHGQWTIEVYNPDGTLDERVDFSNDLTTPGQRVLTDLLTGLRATVPDRWGMFLTGSPNPCEPATCLMNQLTPTPLASSPGFVLSSSVIADVAGNIDFVATEVLTTLADGTSPALYGFTGTSITPVAVEAGQQVQVEVTITFGTL